MGASGKSFTEALQWIKSRGEDVLARSKVLISSALVRNKHPVRIKKERDGLPLLLPSSWHPQTQEKMEVIDSVMEAFREISLELVIMLHSIQKNLHFWRVRQQGSDLMRIRFMVLERGPQAFAEGVVCMLRAWYVEGSATQKLVYDAACRIGERHKMLLTLQQELAALLAQVFMEVDGLGNADQGRKALRVALMNVYKAMISLDSSYSLPLRGYYGHNPIEGSKFLAFNEVSEELLAKAEWSNEEIETVVQCLYSNLTNIKECMAILLPMYERPRRKTRHWFRYSAGALAFVIVSGWLIKHSRLVGSDDLENWLRHSAEAVKDFYEEHVEQPLLSIRDDLFETFRKRHQGAAELGDVRLTAESLSRMLKAFAEQTGGAPLPKDTTEQKLMEIMMYRYETELTHPVKGLLGGELARALLIQVQKLKLDIETAMLELNQILRANEINFAVLAAFPALIFAVSVGYVLRVSLSKGKSAEGRGRAAQLKRRMLLADLERAVMHHQLHEQRNQMKEALWQYGMVLYALDRLYRALSRNGVAKGEWLSLREDILDLSKPSLDTNYKLLITARMGRLYDCLALVPRLK